LVKKIASVSSSVPSPLSSSAKREDLIKKIIIKENEQLHLALTPDINYEELHIYLHENAQLNQTLFFTGQKEQTFTQKLFMCGRGAKARVVGALIGGEGQKYTIKTEQIHTAPDTQSEFHLYGVLYENATCSYSGLITLEKDSLRAHADQQNKMLLMHKTAKAISIPSLQAKHNDLTCGHGAAISYLDSEMLFYLMGRGINQKQAENLLVNGFIPKEVKINS
jgi:Fe-S cluster assembly protein SufD